MKTKSETRRDAILGVALEAFREVGFDAASMSQISARVGGSKATLYNYFASKEELLLEAMLFSAHKHAHDVIRLLKNQGDLPTQLTRFVTSLLKLIDSDETIEVLRVAISVGGTTDIGKRFYEFGTHEVWLVIGDVLRAEIEKGTLRDADPDLMATHLRCLCEVGMIRNLLGARDPSEDEDVAAKAQCIVEVFLKVYGKTA
jgi:AcrR family transcriptional regulator